MSVATGLAQFKACGAATSGAGSSSCPGIHRQPSSALDGAHHRATNALASVASAK